MDETKHEMERDHEQEEEGFAGPKKDRFLPISILVAAILIAGAIVFAVLYRGGAPLGGGSAVNANQPAAGNGATADVSSTASLASLMALEPRDAILGNASASVTLIEYGDYQCPFCGEFFSETQAQIVANYVNTGKVRMIFRNFAFLGPESDATANAALCAEDQNQFWPYHDALYSAKVGDDEGGGSENDGFFTTAELLSLGQKLNLNMAAFTSCVNGNAHANEADQARVAASAAGVNSTPTFLLNGKEISGAQPYSVFQSAIDSALAG